MKTTLELPDDIWDSTVIAAAQELGCKTLYSEHLNHGQDYNGVKISNPFLSS